MALGGLVSVCHSPIVAGGLAAFDDGLDDYRLDAAQPEPLPQLVGGHCLAFGKSEVLPELAQREQDRAVLPEGEALLGGDVLVVQDGLAGQVGLDHLGHAGPRMGRLTQLDIPAA